MHEGRQPSRQSGVLVGLSGGVDSGVAACLLKEAGHHVEGVTFNLWSDSASSQPNRCCSADAILAARELAAFLGIKHYVVDLAQEFYDSVVVHFVREYRRARTPNPCVRCNALLRFPAFLRIADQLGFAHIATGHYARLAGDPSRLMRGSDPTKDQSYVLAQVEPHVLRRALFPLGDLTKGIVRELARARNLPVQAAAESQDICFVPDGNYRRFLARRFRGTPGPIVDSSGVVRGAHAGLHGYTIGQRRGLGISADEPLYVIALRPEDNTLVVGRHAELEVQTLNLVDVVVHRSPRSPEESPRLGVQFRSSGESAVANLDSLNACERQAILHLPRPALGVAPGQLAVLYDGDAVVLAGAIASTSAPQKRANPC